MNATGKYMCYAELAAKFGMPARKATQIVNKLGSLGFLRVKRWMRDRADNERNEYMRSWIKECKEVRGKTYLLWHPQTLTADYGWSDGFLMMLKAIADE